MTLKRLVEEHCRRGCKIPDELMALWNEVNKMMTEESSSDEDSGEENRLPGIGVSDEMHAPPRSPPNDTEASQQLQTALSDHVGHQFEAPTALFSGKPLDALQATRRRSNSSSKSISSSPSAQVCLRRRSSSTQSDFFTSQATAGLPSHLPPVSTRPTKVVQMQVVVTDTASSSASNIPGTMSQVQTISALLDIQAMTEMGTGCALLDDPIKTVGTVYIKETMEYENRAAESPVTSEAASDQNLLSFNSFVDSMVEGYTYSEELFSNATNKDGGNDNIQGWETARTNGGIQFQSQSQSEPTVSFDTMASAEVSPSLLQQIKISSFPWQSAETIADDDVTFAGQNIAWPNKMLMSKAEEQGMSSTNQFQSNVLNQQSGNASRQVGSQNETTSSSVRREGYNQQSHCLGISVNNPIKATVMSHEQLFMLKQKQPLGQNLPSRCSPARNKSATPHQQDVYLPQQVTRTSGEANDATSKADNNAGEVFVNLYNIKAQTGAQHVAHKSTIAINELSSSEITYNNNTDSFSQSSLNIPVSSLPYVSHKRTTHSLVPSTVTPHNATSIITQISSNISSGQIAKHSPFQIANGGSRHGNGRLAETTNNNSYISVSACNPPSQHVSQVTGAKKTVKIFSPIDASPNNNVYVRTPPRLNTSPQFSPQINYIISKNRQNSKASNTAGYTRSSSGGNTSTQSDVQNNNRTTSVVTSGGQQYIIDSRLTLPVPLLPRDIQVSKLINGHPRNTEPSCSSTATADQVSITSTSETILQPMMAFSDINSLGVVAPEDGLLMSVTDVPQDTYEHRISVPEDIDYLSESPEAVAQFSL